MLFSFPGRNFLLAADGYGHCLHSSHIEIGVVCWPICPSFVRENCAFLRTIGGSSLGMVLHGLYGIGYEYGSIRHRQPLDLVAQCSEPIWAAYRQVLEP